MATEGGKTGPIRPVGVAVGLAGFLAALFVNESMGVPLGVAVFFLLALAAFAHRASGFRGSLAVIGTILGMVLISPILSRMPPAALRTFAATFLIATWWVTVAIPIPATSLLPLVLFPVLGVMSSGKTATAYANNNIFLFMGGFILALGIQRWELHRRIALHIVRVIGVSPGRIILGFLTASAILSMWISNTATTLMMLPIALAVISAFDDVEESGVRRGFAPGLLLGVAYGASIGGVGTPIGTPPNISFGRILTILYPGAPEISFGVWTVAFVPLVLLFIPVAWWILTMVHPPGRAGAGAAKGVIREQLRGLGPLGRAERRILVVFALTALLWITRSIRIGPGEAIGWGPLLGEWLGADHLHDATVAVSMAVLTFLLPGDPDEEGRRRPLMDWPTARRLPWGILLLFGGGFALATAFKDSGLSAFLGKIFAEHAAGLSHGTLVAGTSGLLSFLTEVTSNTATTEVMLPVLAGTAHEMGTNPLLLMLPATISASCAFMLPVATPPNAIVFGSGRIEMRDMVKAGILLNLAGIALVTVVFLLWSSRVLSIDLGALPAWAGG